MSIGKYTVWVDVATAWQLGIMFSGYRMDTRRGTTYIGFDIGLPFITISIELVRLYESRNGK